MPSISHMVYVEDISATNLLRKIVTFSTVEQASVGAMWEVVYENDVDKNSEFALNMTYILRRHLNSTKTSWCYAKLVLTANGLAVLVSTQYDPLTDNNTKLVLKGSCKSNDDGDNKAIAVYDNAGALTLPKDCAVPTIFFPGSFSPGSQKIDRAWVVRKLTPLLGDAIPRRNSDLATWCSFCIDEDEAVKPISPRGHYQHFGYGMSGDILVSDTDMNNGAGCFTTVSSFASSGARSDESSPRVFMGGGGTGAGSNLGAIMCAGKVDDVITWFYACSTYGQVRSPLDESLFVGGVNVGFDFTELTTYSPYSGLRVVTPMYIFGRYDEKFVIIGRIPCSYGDMTGLYAGDIITQTENNLVKDWLCVPLIHYGCSSAPESRRCYAIPVPTSEDV